MTNFEMVERLRAKANVSYEEAKAALEQANWDLLDAMVILEKQGKVGSTDQATYTTREEEPETEPRSGHRGKEAARRVAARIVDCVNYLCRNAFEIKKSDDVIVRLPVIVPLMLLIFLLWPTLIALIAGLFCGLKYGFSGPNLDKNPLNSAMDKASEVAENIKKDVSKH
ncbi:MAG: ubiquitin [Clostridia bacterium]|nr:ubiquitin [Clostridia bacterium]